MLVRMDEAEAREEFENRTRRFDLTEKELAAVFRLSNRPDHASRTMGHPAWQPTWDLDEAVETARRVDETKRALGQSQGEA